MLLTEEEMLSKSSITLPSCLHLEYSRWTAGQPDRQTGGEVGQADEGSGGPAEVEMIEESERQK